MAHRIDHIVIAVRDLTRAAAHYEAAGFTVTPGGEHADGETHNALVTFGDGAYFELIAFKEPDRPRDHRWWAKLARGEGLVDYALLVRSGGLDEEATRLRGAGVAVEGPRDGGRLRPDGQRVVWRSVWPDRASGSPLPFLIEDVTPRELRVPGGRAAQHRLGVAGVAGVVVAVGEIERRAAAFAALLGKGEVTAGSVTDGARRGQRFALGASQWIELVEGDDTGGPLRQYLQARGEGVYEVVLDGAEPSGLLSPELTHGARVRIAR